MVKNDIVRRSVSFPKELDDRLEITKNQYSYNAKNELIIELVELGLIKFMEETEIKNRIDQLLSKVELLYEKLGIE